MASLNNSVISGGINSNKDSVDMDLDQGEDRKRRRASVDFIGPLQDPSAMDVLTPTRLDSSFVDNGHATPSEVQKKM